MSGDVDRPPTDAAAAYAGKSVLITGGASFIGSHLVERLWAAGADVAVADDFSSGKHENLGQFPEARIFEIDLADRVRTLRELPIAEFVFHLAAVHGGRGFIDTHGDQVLVNLAIDNNVFTAAAQSGTRRVVHASSACVYPTTLQATTTSRHLLSESEAGFDQPGKAYADGAYGWCKLIGEFQLDQFAASARYTGVSARIFTAYGERENESHAAIALIAKALLRLDPYPVWGDGQQTRNFTYIADSVEGLLRLGSLAAPEPFLAVNVGSSCHHRVVDFLDVVFDTVAWRPTQVELQTGRPVGVASRASDNTLINRLVGWEPRTSLELGVAHTVQWYASHPDRPETAKDLEQLLLARRSEVVDDTRLTTADAMPGLH